MNRQQFAVYLADLVTDYFEDRVEHGSARPTAEAVADAILETLDSHPELLDSFANDYNARQLAALTSRRRVG